jgi:hypothetical protein
MPRSTGKGATPKGVRTARVRLVDFKLNARRLLPKDHPLLLILKNVPDEVDAAELDARLPDWIALLEA